MKKYTLLILSDNLAKPSQYNVSGLFLRFCFTLLLAALGFAGFLSFDYMQLRQIRQMYYKSMAENNHLKGEAQILIENLEEVKESLGRIQDYTTKLDEIVNLKINKISKKTGIGPLSAEEEAVSQDSIILEEPKPKNRIPLGIHLEHLTFKPVLKEIDDIESRSQQQAIELKRLLSTLSQKKSLLSSIPSITPTQGWITSIFGQRISPFTGTKTVHRGIDIAAPVGTPITAPADGVVIFSGAKAGFGNFVMIAHYGYGIVTRYGHNAQNLVTTGQRVRRGEQIASVGLSGRSTGPHLHYEVWINGQAANPKKFILDFNTDFF